MRQPETYFAVVNDDGAHSIWPDRRSLPDGWSYAGFSGSREDCLAYIGTVWTIGCSEREVPEPATESSTSERAARAGHRLDLMLLAAAREYPDRIALTIGEENFTYAELIGRAEALAGQLRLHGARPESFVGVTVDRSAEAVIAIFGVVLSGAAYLPLDVEAPLQRLREITREASADLITGVRAHEYAADLGVAEVAVPPSPSTVPTAPSDELKPVNAAYAIFTSGSTGKPKGVVVEHRAIVNSTAARFAVFPHDSMTYLMLAPLAFDAAAAGLYFTFAAGGRLIVPTNDESLDPGLIGDLVTRHHVTHLDGVPSQYAVVLEFVAAELAGLRCVVVAGEALAQGLVRQHTAALPDVPLFNEYGPTESAVWATCHRTDPADEGPFAPVGVPVAGVDVVVVDGALDPVPHGEIGEIAISGRQLARGYLGHPGLTADRFVPHPRSPGKRMYRTGDRGRVDERGKLVYCGRSGSMVKVRGFRVEPSEVEGWLRAQPDVVDAVVLAEPFAGTIRLVAATVRSVQKGSREPSSLKTRLAERLPAYMIPTLWHEIERMPLTTNGKIDRAAVAVLVGVTDAHSPAAGLGTALAEQPLRPKE